jgi:ribonucleoside-diphosphate reductase alpha chain
MNNELMKYFKGDSLAAGVWLGKYALSGEKTPDDMHRRMAEEFARMEIINKAKYNTDNKAFLSSYGFNRQLKDAEEFIYHLFKDFKYVIPQGSVMSQLGANTIGSLSNCFVIGQPEDSYGGIFQKDEEMAQLEKRRGGVGIDLSSLRPVNTPTSNAAKTSTGAVSFMHRFSNTTREVAQNGRRGALMISMDINHPDVLEFIKIKRDLTQVTGANISIKLNNEFMKAVENNESYCLRFPIDKKPIRKMDMANNVLYGHDKGFVKWINAREYWDEIIKSAHNVAEPGLMYWDAMINYSPDGVYNQYRAITTNPCSEIGMQAYDACRLIAVNLRSFVDNPLTKDAIFNYDKFYEVNYEAMRLGDNLVDLEIEHIDRILAKIESDPESDDLKHTERNLWTKIRETASSSRRTGIGFTALGDTLAALNLKYDSEEAIKQIDAIMRVKMRSELDCTIDLSILLGSFEGFDEKKEFYVDGNNIYGKNDFYDMLSKEFPSEALRMFTFGRRNVSWSTVAPTGTVSLLAQTTSGIEPLFQGFYTRRKKININDDNVRVDFTDQNGDTWQEFNVVHPKFKDWIIYDSPEYGESIEDANIRVEKLSKKDLQELFELSPWYGSTANDIDWLKRIKVQSTIQKYITHSISSTINLPENITEEEVSQIYLKAWEQDIKGITVYRDGSRSGVLVNNTEIATKFAYNNAVKRPKTVEAEAKTTMSDGKKYSIFVGLVDGIPYEVFAFMGGTKEGKGSIVKEGKGEYYFIGEGDNSKNRILTGRMTEEQEIITRLISGSLRHGRGIHYIVDDLNKTSGSLFSFNFAIAKVLKTYIPDGVKSTITCADCGSTDVIFEEGCVKCLECGNTKCG